MRALPQDLTAKLDAKSCMLLERHALDSTVGYVFRSRAQLPKDHWSTETKVGDNEYVYTGHGTVQKLLATLDEKSVYLLSLNQTLNYR